MVGRCCLLLLLPLLLLLLFCCTLPAPPCPHLSLGSCEHSVYCCCSLRRRPIDRTLEKPGGVEAAVFKGGDAEGSEEENAPMMGNGGCEQDSEAV